MMSFDFEYSKKDENTSSFPKKDEAKTVTEISQELKVFVERNFNKVLIKGEIFGAKRADSGHWYLSLKDENAVLSAVCWKGVANSLKIKIEDGLSVIARGKITTFAGKSSYQLVIESLELEGQGALLKLLEEKKQQFYKEGLFDASHKLAIPFLPSTIGVVTSPTGAVIRDIIHRIRDRFPSHILVWPTPVQGVGAEQKIAEAIRGFNALPQTGSLKRPDLIIVARGGGSLEDLWAFNEECVIRAVYDSTIPIISAVGHETDTMLIDYVSDKRAPTPTGAAEFAVPVREELLFSTNALDNRLQNSIRRYLEEYKNKIEGLTRGIPNLKEIINENTQKLDYRIERLEISIKNYMKLQTQNLSLKILNPIYVTSLIERYKERINSLDCRLEAVSIDSVLKRGFAWIKGEASTITSKKEAMKENTITIQFSDGSIKTSVIKEKSSPKTSKLKSSKDEKKEDLLFDF